MPASAYRSPCVDCNAPAYGERCRPCANAAKVYGRARIRPDDDHRVQRRHREQAAPGLTAHQRTKLLRRWKRQSRPCAYCPALAATVDHVVPLVRGGTNHEGNLIPACRSCNGRKGGLMLIEWRTGRRLPPMTAELPWLVTVGNKRRVREVPWPVSRVYFGTCLLCSTPFASKRAPRKYCGATCAKEAKAEWGRRRSLTPVGTSRQCTTCDRLVTAPRQKCDECVAENAREAKRRNRRQYRASESGRRSRREYERRRYYRRKAKVAQVGGPVAA